LNSFDIMTGPGDEFRLNERTHSSSWIRTEYRNQHDPLNFFVFGLEEPGGSVPVKLLSARAVREEHSVHLSWEVAEEGEGLSGFQVYRVISGTPTRAGSGAISGGPVYTWIDTDPPTFAFNYRLLALNRTGESSWLGPIPVTAALGIGPRLLASPNPFHDQTLFQADLNQRGRLTLRVIDLSGREIRTIFDAVAGPGPVEAIWNGRDAMGRRASPGAYLIVANHPSGSLAKKILLLPE